MAKLEKFLFFYSILAVTVLTLSFGLFSPRPLNLISLLAFLPSFFYFWLRLTSPAAVSPERWSARLLAVLVVLASLGIYTLFLAKQRQGTELAIKYQLAQEQAKNETLKKEIAELKTKLSATPKPIVKEENISDILLIVEVTPSPTPTQAL